MANLYYLYIVKSMFDNFIFLIIFFCSNAGSIIIYNLFKLELSNWKLFVILAGFELRTFSSIRRQHTTNEATEHTSNLPGFLICQAFKFARLSNLHYLSLKIFKRRRYLELNNQWLQVNTHWYFNKLVWNNVLHCVFSEYR